MRPRTWAWFLLCLLTLNICRAGTPESLVVATFNLENYLLEPAGNRPSKSIAARDQVAREIAAIRPDVLAIQEIGPGGAMGDLQQRVRTAGWELPHTEVVGGWDTNIWVAVLSRYPFRARRSHTNDSFLLGGRRWHSSRGIAEVDVEPRPGIRFTLLSTHLKSKRPSANADEAELREAETRLLRQHVDAAFQRDPHVALIVCGDLNDHKDSRPIRLLLGKGPGALVDTRPA
ncbi:MAG TPA: hypothetical protein DCE44_26605, partial [Verrucomicrobiales bacterium]|nr:hypothetical protein [Verrucomicrobiales bacterium]